MGLKRKIVENAAGLKKEITYRRNKYQLKRRSQNLIAKRNRQRNRK